MGKEVKICVLFSPGWLFSGTMFDAPGLPSTAGFCFYKMVLDDGGEVSSWIDGDCWCSTVHHKLAPLKNKKLGR